MNGKWTLIFAVIELIKLIELMEWQSLKKKQPQTKRSREMMVVKKWLF